MRVRGDPGREQARTTVQAMLTHLSTGGVGTLSEIFDGDPPHTPRGAFARAWTVGEVLRGYIEDVCEVAGNGSHLAFQAGGANTNRTVSGSAR